MNRPTGGLETANLPRIMKLIVQSLLVGLAALSISGPAEAWQPLRAHPQNPYLLEFRGQPTVLRTYGEHYSSILNSEFDFIPYLNVLKRDGMNLTRAFTAGFRLAEGDYNQTPLSPAPAAYVQPWKRVAVQGNALDGLPKWDFSAWNEDFFARLHVFAQACSERGIAIELTLFCVQYTDLQWRTSPFHPSNNVQGVGPASRYDSMRMVDTGLLAAQEAFVRRLVREMNPYDNIYYEIENEPFWNEPGVKDAEEVAFHHHMLAVIRDEESRLPNRHLVAHNFPQQLSVLSSDFDVINEHYPAAVPNTTVAGAEALLRDHHYRGRILSFDETDTTSPVQTRLESWMFFLGGGGIYNGLDLPVSVYVEEDESGDSPSGNSYRTAVRNIGTYVGGLRLTGLRRSFSWVTGGIPSGATLQAMAEPGQQYVAYLHHGRGSLTNFQLSYQPIDGSNHTASLVTNLPAGTWRAVWTRPLDLVQLGSQVITHTGGPLTLNAVTYQEDVALRIDRIAAGPNTAPVANPETYAVQQDTPLTVPAKGVLTNDADAHADPLIAVLDDGPAHGLLALNGSGGFTYTPAAGYSGTDSFTYHASDGSLDSNEVTVTITINAVVASGFANGGFESGFAGWTVTGNQEILTSSPGTFPEGVKCAAFNRADSIPNGVLTRTFPTVAGQTYLLSFHMGVVASNTNEQRLDVDVSGATAPVSQMFPLQGLGGGGTRWAAKNLTFQASGTVATVTFRDRSLATVDIDLLLDNVTIQNDSESQPSDPVPLATPSLTLTPGTVQIATFATEAGTYDLLRSTDLVVWTVVDEIVLLEPGSLNFTDTTTSETRMFYRIATRP
ncbi:MAG: Ig-like domain-containing protein [Verrucomicrobiota bacterium]